MKKTIVGIFISGLIAAIAIPVSSAQEEKFTDPVLDPAYMEYYYPYDEMVYSDPYLLDAVLLDPVIVERVEPTDPVITPDPYEDPYIDPYADPNLDPNYPPEEEYIPPEEFYPPEDEYIPPEEEYPPEETYPPEEPFPPLEYFPPEETPETGTAATGTETGSTGNGLFIPGMIDTRTPPEDRPERDPEEEEEEEEPEVIVIQPENPHPIEVINRVIPQVTRNQLNIILIILVGVAAGTLVWLLTGYIINSTQANRDTKRSNRQTAYAIHNKKMDQLKESYNKVNDALSTISDTFSSKSTPTKQNIDAFKKASVEIELFGSKETVKAQKNMTNLLAQSKAPTQKEYNSAKNELLQSLKKDLGI